MTTVDNKNSSVTLELSRGGVWFAFVIVVIGFCSVFAILNLKSRSILSNHFSNATLLLLPDQPSNGFESLGVTLRVVDSDPKTFLDKLNISGLNRDTAFPILLNSNSSKSTYFAGWSAIKGNTKLYGDSLDANRNGMLASGLTLALVVTVFLYRSEARPWILWVTLLGMGLLLALPSSCSSCQSLSGALFGLAPLLIALFLVFSFSAFGWSKTPAIAYSFIAAGAFVLILGQCYLLSTEPRFCPVCVVMGGILALTLFTAIGVIQSRSIQIIGAQNFLRFSSWLAALSVVTIQIGYATGKLSSSHIRQWKQSQNYSGRIASSLIEGKSSNIREGVYLVTRSGCGACDLAKSGLSFNKVKFEVLPECSLVSGTPCFNDAKGFSTPQIIVINRSGMITLSFEGWPSAVEGVTDLVESINRELWRN